MTSSTNATKPFQVAVVGGGLGGLALTIGLLRHRVDVHIYESAPSFGEIGAGIMFGPHAVNALRLISPDMLDAFKRCVTHNLSEDKRWAFPIFQYGMDSRNGNGKKSGDLIWQAEPIEEVRERIRLSGTATMNSLHRARFLDECVKLVPEGTATFNKALTKHEEVDIKGKRMVKMWFADGTTALADAIIGCDGIKSKVRTTMYPDVVPEYVGEYAYRSLIDANIVKRILGEKLAMNANLWKGYGGYIINYPVEHGKIINLVVVVQDMQGFPGKSYDQMIIPGSKDDMYEDLKDWDLRLQDLLREFKSADKWTLWDLPHNKPYNRGRVCLLGDAAHACLPHIGSGAGMAMEDAYMLSSLISEAKGSADLEEVFRVFDAVRRERTQKLVWKSRETGRAHAMNLEGVGDDFDAMQAESKVQHPWTWEYDLEAGLEDAKTMISKS